MIKKTSVIQKGSILMAILVFMVASESLAFFYRPAASVSILSEYKACTDSSFSFTQAWKVVPEATPDGRVRLRFFLDAAVKAEAVCELELSSLGPVGEIRWQGIGERKEKVSNTGLLLAPGFPAPCDILPIGKEDEREYQEKTEAGGRVFIKTYRVSSAAFSLEEAKAKGWIKVVEAQGISELILVTATDKKGQLAVKQLWPTHGSWWLYEETPMRRSWRID